MQPGPPGPGPRRLVRRPPFGARAAGAAIMLWCAAACEAGPRPERAGEMAGGDTAGDVADSSAPLVPSMAVTIDDLPWVGALRPGETREAALRSLADTLVAHDVGAIGFVNCDRAPQSAALRSWVDAGLELGNHTAAHLDLNTAPLEQWLGDVRSCHEMVRGITRDELVWFRYPFLHQGPSAERQNAALAELEELGSPIAHVTIDNSDWILAVAYGEAVAAGDSERAAAIGAAFVEHIIRATQHYQQVAQQKAGRDIPHVLLLHANLLVTDHMGTLLDRLRTEHGFRFVTVEAAHEDPVYSLPDGYTGGGGLSWLYRMEPPSPEMAARDDAEAQRLRQEWR